ncbi:transposase [Methylomusa anaerophila]|uniref:transposase n=2 Tax=Methylomusa anaerophila TaxID=1930071 RepID=UPI000F8302EA
MIRSDYSTRYSKEWITANYTPRTSRMGRITSHLKRLFKILVYGYMNGLYSSHKLEQACGGTSSFLYRLGREKAPDSPSW